MSNSGPTPPGGAGATRPSGNDKVSSTSERCPWLQKANLMVEVYLGKTSTILKRVSDVDVTVTGPSAGRALASNTATIFVNDLDPGAGYDVSIAASAAGDDLYGGARIERSMPKPGAFPLAAGETARVIFRLYPAVSALKVSVVNKETDAVITNERFTVDVATSAEKKKATEAGIALFPEIKRGRHDNITVTLEGEQTKRYKLPAAAASADVPRGGTGEARVLLAPIVGVVLDSVTPVFAPTKDDVDVVCHCENAALVQSMMVEIKDAKDKLVFQKVYRRADASMPNVADDAQKVTYPWPKAVNGKAPDGTEIAVGRSPFTAVVWASAADLTDAADFKPDRAVSSAPAPDHRVGKDRTVVRCHSLTLELVPWEEAYRDFTNGKDPATVPVAEAKPIKVAWIKYKLNEMGFFAGPIDDDDAADEFKRALKRYRVMRLVPRDPHVVPLGASVHVPGENPVDPTTYALENAYDCMFKWDGANFVESEQSKKDALVQLAGDDEVNQLLVYLSMERPWDAVDKRAEFTDKTKELRLLVHNNRYYMSTSGEWDGVPRWDFSATENYCYKIAKEWLTQPHLPIRAIVKVEDRTGAAQSVPSAVKDVHVAWSWKDEAETLNHLPSYNTADRVDGSKLTASRTKEYLTKAWAVAHNGALIYRNVTKTFGGCIAHVDDDDSWSAFHPYRDGRDFAGGKKKPAAGANPGWVLTPTREFTRPSGEREAAAFVHLKTSVVGGDNYRLKVWLDFSQCGADEAELDALHGAQTAAREVDNPLLPGGSYKLTDDRLARVETARITVWRRMTIAAMVEWPSRAPPNSWNDSQWSQPEWEWMRREYADAYIDIPPFGERNAVSVSDAAAFPTFDADYQAAMSAIPKPQRTGWEAPGLDVEMKTLDVDAVNVELLKFLGPQDAKAVGAKEALELAEKWIADVGPSRELLNPAGQFYKGAIETVTDAGAAARNYKGGLDKNTLSARAERDFDANGLIADCKKDLDAKVADLRAALTAFNAELKGHFPAGPPAPIPADTPSNTVADLLTKADLCIHHNDPDPLVQAALRKEGSHYRALASDLVTAGVHPVVWVFKPNLRKADLAKRAGFAAIAAPAGTIRTFKDDTFEKEFGQMKPNVTKVNEGLTPRVTVAVNAAPLIAFAAKIDQWSARNDGDWQAIYPDWTSPWTVEIKRAATHYTTARGHMARQAPATNAWEFKPAITRESLLAKAPGAARPPDGWSPYFEDDQFPKPGALRAYKADEAVFAAGLRLRADGIYPFRLNNNQYDLAKAREMMMNAAAQIGFALTLLMHTSVRRKIRLRVQGGKFEQISDGAVMVDNITHPTMTLLDGTPWTPFGLSMGSDLGVFFTSHFTPLRLYALGAHEWGHVLILQHWYNADGAPKTEHDQSDMNCMMGYPYLPGKGNTLPNAGTNDYTVLRTFVGDLGKVDKYEKFLRGESGGSFGVYKTRMLPLNHLPHFCGKCNLQLRGWNICATGTPLPRSSAGADPNADAMPAAAAYDTFTFDSGNL